MKKKLFRERQEDSLNNFLEDFLLIEEPIKEEKTEEPKLVKKKRKVAKK